MRRAIYLMEFESFWVKLSLLDGFLKGWEVYAERPPVDYWILGYGLDGEPPVIVGLTDSWYIPTVRETFLCCWHIPDLPTALEEIGGLESDIARSARRFL